MMPSSYNPIPPSLTPACSCHPSLSLPPNVYIAYNPSPVYGLSPGDAILQQHNAHLPDICPCTSHTTPHLCPCRLTPHLCPCGLSPGNVGTVMPPSSILMSLTSPTPDTCTKTSPDMLLPPNVDMTVTDNPSPVSTQSISR